VTYGKNKDGSLAMERVNKLAARASSNIHTPIEYHTLLKKIGWRSIEWEATKEQLRIMFCHVNATSASENIPKPLRYIIPETSRRTSRLTHSRTFTITTRHPHLSRSLQSATYQMVRKWNSLPASIVNITSLDSFTRELMKLEDSREPSH
jgi:hypothetical protein